MAFSKVGKKQRELRSEITAASYCRSVNEQRIVFRAKISSLSSGQHTIVGTCRLYSGLSHMYRMRWRVHAESF